MMVATDKRREAAELLLRYYKGQITNDQLWDSWPRESADPVLRQLAWPIWIITDDLHEHSIDPRARTQYAFAREMHRYLTFLNSDLEYEWIGSGLSAGLIPWLLEHWNRHRREVNRAGDNSVWPFYRKEDYKRAWKLGLSQFSLSG